MTHEWVRPMTRKSAEGYYLSRNVYVNSAGVTLLIIRLSHITALPCKAKRQYLLTCEISRYCLLALLCRAIISISKVIAWQKVTFAGKTWLDKHDILSLWWFNGGQTLADAGPPLIQHSVNASCYLVSGIRGVTVWEKTTWYLSLDLSHVWERESLFSKHYINVIKAERKFLTQSDYRSSQSREALNG